MAWKVAADAKCDVDEEMAAEQQLQATAVMEEQLQGQQVRKPLAKERESSQPALNAVAAGQGTEQEDE